jgi:hypothetical protein
MDGYSQFDASALGIANWYINEYVDRLPDDDVQAKKLRQLAEHFRDPMKSIIEINDGEYIDIGIAALSWLHGSQKCDRVGCNIRFDGIITSFAVCAAFSQDLAVILTNETDLQGSDRGRWTDFIFFRSVAETIFRSESYRTFSEIYPFEIIK